MLVESASNPRIRAIAALRDRAGRREAGATIVDGARECLRALATDMPVQAALVCEPLVRTDEARAVLDALARRGIVPLRVGERAYAKVAYGDRSDGVVLVVPVPDTTLAQLAPVLSRPDALVVVAEDVEKPGNLGAILRSADGAGGSAVIAVGGTDAYNPNVIRASVGTIFRVPLATASADETLAALRGHGLRMLAARVDGATLYTDADLHGRVAIVLGSEADGLSAAWDQPDVHGIRLPMHGIADSLNVSVTAAVLLYEARRQRTEGP